MFSSKLCSNKDTAGQRRNTATEFCLLCTFTYLGIFRNTMHWNFSSWILGVRSVPSHWGRQRRWKSDGDEEMKVVRGTDRGFEQAASWLHRYGFKIEQAPKRLRSRNWISWVIIICKKKKSLFSSVVVNWFSLSHPSCCFELRSQFSVFILGFSAVSLCLRPGLISEVGRNQSRWGVTSDCLA